jgi:hypothetical protein
MNYFNSTQHTEGQGGRIPARAELQDFIRGRGGQPQFDFDVWAPVFEPEDWIQVGAAETPAGGSYLDKFGQLPEWHADGGANCTNIAIVFAPV